MIDQAQPIPPTDSDLWDIYEPCSDQNPHGDHLWFFEGYWCPGVPDE
jgi:hypothetical protein